MSSTHATTSRTVSTSTIALLTREAFLKSLSPPPADSNLEEECPICFNPPTDPLTLPCTHNFCTSCMTTWLTTPSKNTCPLDRTVLFSLPTETTPPLNPQTARRIIVTLAFHSSPLNTPPGEPVTRTQHFDCPRLRPSNADLNRATQTAMEFLVRSAPEAQIRDGNVAMERQNLGSHLVAMVHLIPAFARAQGRPYGPREMECWAEIVRGLWYAVKCMEESPERSAVAVAAEMRTLSRRHMNFGTFSRMNEFYAEFVGPGDELAGDLLVLINYLVVRGKIRHQEKESARQMRGHTRCVVM